MSRNVSNQGRLNNLENENIHFFQQLRLVAEEGLEPPTQGL